MPSASWSSASQRPTSSQRVLTIGDGDCSYSLGLARAFGDGVRITCTTLVPEDEVVSTYAAAGRCLQELRQRGVTIVHGVDATAIPASMGVFEHVCFCHPHLGLDDMLDEAAHARRFDTLPEHSPRLLTAARIPTLARACKLPRHGVLIAHFLSSAAAVLAPSQEGGKQYIRERQKIARSIAIEIRRSPHGDSPAT